MLENSLADNIQASLRDANHITMSEVAVQIGDLFVAVNIVDGNRRQLDASIIGGAISTFSENISESSSKTLLKG